MSGFRLLRYASMLVDMGGVLAICTLLQAIGQDRLTGILPLVILVMVVGLAYVAATDFIFNGRSPGKVLLGFRAIPGRRFSRQARFSARALGLADVVSPDESRAFRHDRHADIRFASPVVGVVSDWLVEISVPGRSPRLYQLSLFTRFREQGYIRIGRDWAWADITLPDAARRTSRRHLVIYRRDQRLFVMNHDARNGMEVDGNPLPARKQSARVEAGSRVTLPAGNRPQVVIRILRSAPRS